MGIISRIISWVKGRILSKTFLKFNVVGGVGVIVNMGLFWILTEYLATHHLIAGAIATEVSIVNNFILNHLWTFRERRGGMHILIRAGAFHLSRLLGLLTTLGSLFILVDVLGLPSLPSYFLSIGFGVLANFYTSDAYVWADR